MTAEAVMARVIALRDFWSASPDDETQERGLALTAAIAGIPADEWCETCAHTRDEHDEDGSRGNHVFKPTGRFDITSDQAPLLPDPQPADVARIAHLRTIYAVEEAAALAVGKPDDVCPIGLCYLDPDHAGLHALNPLYGPATNWGRR